MLLLRTILFFPLGLAKASPPNETATGEPRTVCVRRSVLKSVILFPGTITGPSIEGMANTLNTTLTIAVSPIPASNVLESVAISTLLSSSPKTSPNAVLSPTENAIVPVTSSTTITMIPLASTSTQLMNDPTTTTTPLVNPVSPAIVPLSGIKSGANCTPGLFLDSAKVLYNLTCESTVKVEIVFAGTLPDIQSCASRCSDYRKNSTGCESVRYGAQAIGTNQNVNCVGIVGSSNPYAEPLLDFAVPVHRSYTVGNGGIMLGPDIASLSGSSILSSSATSPTSELASTFAFSSSSSTLFSPNVAFSTISPTSDQSPGSSFSLASSLSESTRPSPSPLPSSEPNDSTTNLSTSPSRSSSSTITSSSLVALIPSSRSASTASPSLISSPSSTSSDFSTSSSTEQAQSTSRTPSSGSPTSSVLSNVASSESSLSSTLYTSDPTSPTAASSESSLFPTSYTSIATSPAAASSENGLSITSYISPVTSVFAVSSSAACPSIEYIKNGDFSNINNGASDAWTFDPNDGAQYPNTGVFVRPRVLNPPDPNNQNIEMIVDNSGQSPGDLQALPARSVSISQRLPGLCTGSAYVVKWTNRIELATYGQKKRTPAPNNGCTVGFSLVDQLVSVIGGPEGAPLPYAQTRNGDIFRYRGQLDYNILTVTLNCSSYQSNYFIDDISFVGPTGTCCQSAISGVGAESTAYSLTTIASIIRPAIPSTSTALPTP